MPPQLMGTGSLPYFCLLHQLTKISPKSQKYNKEYQNPDLQFSDMGHASIILQTKTNQPLSNLV